MGSDGGQRVRQGPASGGCVWPRDPVKGLALQQTGLDTPQHVPLPIGLLQSKHDGHPPPTPSPHWTEPQSLYRPLVSLPGKIFSLARSPRSQWRLKRGVGGHAPNEKERLWGWTKCGSPPNIKVVAQLILARFLLHVLWIQCTHYILTDLAPPLPTPL